MITIRRWRSQPSRWQFLTTSLGARPTGWLGPWISESRHTPDLPAIIERRQEAETFAGMIRSAVEQLLSECDHRPLVLGIALHPYIMGQAHHVPPLARVLTELREADDPRIWWTTAGEIAEHVEANGLAV